jgi:prephenate dehydrogenase
VAIKTCGVVGMGLMGGSLGLALRARGIAIAAVDENRESLSRALERGAADRASTDPVLLSDVDLVVICTPPSAIVSTAAHVLAHLKSGCLLTDFGSVKAPIVKAIEPLLTPRARYVGLHPMCGTAGHGIESARQDLFLGSVLIATPTERTTASALDEASELATLLGMRLLRLSPEEHDRQIAVVSHLPYLMSIALTRLAPGFECAGPSFRDATRVALSPSALWGQILSLNHSHLIAAIDQIREELARLGALRGDALERTLEEARELRSRWDVLPVSQGISDRVSEREKGRS